MFSGLLMKLLLDTEMARMAQINLSYKNSLYIVKISSLGIMYTVHWIFNLKKSRDRTFCTKLSISCFVSCMSLKKQRKPFKRVLQQYPKSILTSLLNMKADVKKD